jgi:hypothetical protein
MNVLQKYDDLTNQLESKLKVDQIPFIGAFSRRKLQIDKLTIHLIVFVNFLLFFGYNNSVDEEPEEPAIDKGSSEAIANVLINI